MNDPRATTARAKQALASGQIQQAIALFENAADGDGEAAAFVATLAAWGALRPCDLHQALDLLARAARLGWAPAQAQLRFLVRDKAGAKWEALRDRVDLDAWIKAPAPRSLSESPRLRVFENFATPEECDWLIARGRGGLARAQVLQGSTTTEVSDLRTNTEADYLVTTSDIVVALIRDRIAQATQTHQRFFENTKLLNYQPGEEYRRHTDYFATTPYFIENEINIRGQRVATFLLYLNDDYDAGETAFPDAGIQYKGRKGDALLFLNVSDDGAPDLLSVHAGTPPAGGEKWVLSQWIRNRTINASMTPGVSNDPLAPRWAASV